jgi:CheY-like chemotaxis protein
MPKVLIAAAAERFPALGRTLLWRSDVEKTFVDDAEAALEAARSLQPNLVLLDGSRPQAALDFIHRLRSDGAVRRLPIAVAGVESRTQQDALRREGADEVLSDGQDPFQWDARLERLLAVPPRRELRVPVRLRIWCRAEPGGSLQEGLAINVSIRGMLLETGQAFEVGSKLELEFRLPRDEEALGGVAQVVREAQPFEGRRRYGLEFQLLRGAARQRIAAFLDAGAGR